MLSTCAFIFARSGSKGLPNKNVLEICGQPLLVHSIRHAQRLKSVDMIFVSTDSEEISAVAEEAGASTIMRPCELASDSAPEWLAWRHAIEEVNKLHGNFRYFLSLPTTAPLRSTEDVERCLYTLYSSNGTDIVITVTPSSRSPWFNMVKMSNDGIVKPLINLDSISRRQDAPESFDITTVAYAADTKFILSTTSMWSGRVAAVVVPQERALDIDTHFDYRVAKLILESQ